MAIPAKLAKLIPMLSSPMDGEVVAAARAIEKSLKGAGLDWHDLVNAISFNANPSKAKPSKAWADTGHNAEPDPYPNYDDLYADFIRREMERTYEQMHRYRSQRQYHWDEAAGEFRKTTEDERARYWEGRRKGEDT